MLVDPTEERLTHLTTQLKWRVAEGQGEAIYAIGVEVYRACPFLCLFSSHDSKQMFL